MKVHIGPDCFRKRSPQQGFTLVEMIIALGIFSFILIGLLTIIEHMDQKEDWLKSRATTNAELDATLQTIEKFWDLMDWEQPGALSIQGNGKKITLVRPINFTETETMTIIHACQSLNKFPKEIAASDPSFIEQLKLMRKCGGDLCPRGKLPVVRILYSHNGAVKRNKMFPHSAKSNISTGSTLGIGMCAFAAANGEQMQLELEGIFFSKHEKSAPFRKMTMFRTYIKGNRIGDDVKLFKNGDSL